MHKCMYILNIKTYTDIKQIDKNEYFHSNIDTNFSTRTKKHMHLEKRHSVQHWWQSPRHHLDFSDNHLPQSLPHSLPDFLPAASTSTQLSDIQN